MAVSWNKKYYENTQMNFWKKINWIMCIVHIDILQGKIKIKELSFCHKLWFSYPYIFATQCRRTLIFQTMNHVRPNNLSLKYHRFAPSGCKDIQIRKFEFVAKTQFFLEKKKSKCFSHKGLNGNRCKNLNYY